MHWHVDPVTHHAKPAQGSVGECCEGYATYEEVFGP